MPCYGSESFLETQGCPCGRWKSSDIDKLRSVDVIVTKISEIKPRIHRAVFKCESCGHDIEIDQENERELKEPLNCPQALGGCGSTKVETRFDLVLLEF